MILQPYDRQKAVDYAHQWAMSRNPAFFDFSELGGDCTNFASQCVYAGAGVMNFTREVGWFYINANDRTPSWTGVEFFYNFMVNNRGLGPVMREVPLLFIRPGDVIQLRFKTEGVFEHAPVVVSAGFPPRPDNILVAAHSYDSDNRPLNTYEYNALRPLHVVGVWHPDNETMQSETNLI